MKQSRPDRLLEEAYRLCEEALKATYVTHEMIVEIEEKFTAADEHEDSTIGHTIVCGPAANRLNHQRDDYGRYAYPPCRTRKEELEYTLSNTTRVTVNE